MDCVVRPPEPGEESYETFIHEKNEMHKALAEKAAMLTKELDSIDGISCNAIQGALYAFPKVGIKYPATSRLRESAWIRYPFQTTLKISD